MTKASELTPPHLNICKRVIKMQVFLNLNDSLVKVEMGKSSSKALVIKLVLIISQSILDCFAGFVFYFHHRIKGDTPNYSKPTKTCRSSHVTPYMCKSFTSMMINVMTTFCLACQ